jgi:hypothetical protein
MGTRALVLLLAAMGALACCGRPDPGAQDLQAPGAHGALRDSIRGVWSVRPARSAIEKTRADLRKAARGDEQKLDEMVRSFEQSMAGVTLEITGEAMITRTYERHVSSARYEVVREEGRTITLRLAGAGRGQAFTLEPDGSLSADMQGLGAVVLQRRR